MKTVMAYSYTHHICRLMVLGQYFLLCRCHPDEVAEWFTAFVAIDSYDVFMVPNIYGMSQYADGGKLVMKRPYVSSSRYLMKFGRYTPNDSIINGKPWTDTWDSLYYCFIDDHQDILASNYSMAPHVNRWRSMDIRKRRTVIETAKKYLSGISSG